MKSMLTLPVAVLLALLTATAATQADAEALSVMWGVQTAQEATFNAAVAAGKFSCLDGTGVKDMPIKRVNDQFCDCADGSDEPGTSACSFQIQFPETWRFQCHSNIGGVYKELFHSRVNDGICDCCDGSDEYDGNTQCANNCAEAAEKEEKEARVREARRQAGLAAKKQLEQAGETTKIETARMIADAEAELAGKEALLAPLQAKKEAEEELEGNEKALIHQKSLKEKAIWEEEQRKKQEAAELKKQEDAAAAGTVDSEHPPDTPLGKKDDTEIPTPAEEEESAIICSKWRQTQACKGNGNRDDTADQECITVIQGGWSGYCECFDSKEGVEVTFPFDCGHQPLTCDYVCRHNGVTAQPSQQPEEAVTEPAEPTFDVDTGSNHVRPEAQAARTEYEAINTQKGDAERKIADLKATTESDYWEYPAFLALKDVCASKDAGSYSYHVCIFKDIHQGGRGQTHAGGTLMGKFEGFGEQTYAAWGAKHDLTKQKYGHGQHCYSGPDRSVEVSVICGPTTELLSVDEPSMCTYKMVLQTPAVCE